MSSLFEIDGNILALLSRDMVVDEETGEILLDLDDLDALEIEHQEKIENVALYVKSLKAEAAAIKAEEAALAERRKAKESKAETLTRYISRSMELFGDTKIETARVALSFRKSEAVVISDEAAVPECYTAEKVTRTVDKAAIKKALKAGDDVAGAYIEQRSNLQIK